MQIGDRVTDGVRVGTVIAVGGAGVEVVWDAKVGEVPVREVLRSWEVRRV